MKIKDIIRQYRRDFCAIYECQFCGATKQASGYDDANFHQNVIPQMVCEKCGKSVVSECADYRALTTKYPEGYQV